MDTGLLFQTSGFITSEIRWNQFSIFISISCEMQNGMKCFEPRFVWMLQILSLMTDLWIEFVLIIAVCLYTQVSYHLVSAEDIERLVLLRESSFSVLLSFESLCVCRTIFITNKDFKNVYTCEFGLSLLSNLRKQCRTSYVTACYYQIRFDSTATSVHVSNCQYTIKRSIRVFLSDIVHRVATMLYYCLITAQHFCYLSLEICLVLYL